MDVPQEQFPLTPTGDDGSPLPGVSSSPRPGSAPRHSAKTRWIVLGIAIAVLAAGGSAYWLLRPRQPRPMAPAATENQQQAATDTGAPQQYVSNGKDLNLGFTYPAGWTVSPASGHNTDDQTITVTSPLVSLVDANGQTVSGDVVVSIRPSAAPLDELAGDTATAARDSLQMAYTHPTKAQHQYPYLTFIHLRQGANPSKAFEEVMITGVMKFTAGQGILPESLGGLDPVVSAAFYACTGGNCKGADGGTPLSTTYQTWQNADAFQQVQAIFSSLELK